MNVIKRSGEETLFNYIKIVNAVMSANKDVKEKDKIPYSEALDIAKKIEEASVVYNRTLHVEEIQNLVEDHIIQKGYHNLAKEYIKYRYKRELVRKSNSTDKQILSIIELNNEEIKQENSNKNPVINSTQRDYMAGETSKDISRRYLLPKEVIEAHDEGLIHFHDMDYFAQHMHNCCLVNLEDMLTNGTMISGVMIESPKSFVTACTIATQIIAQVASSQYGGQSISLAHLVPFVQKDRLRFTQQVREEFEFLGVEQDEEKINSIVEKRVKREIEKGIQTMNYQVITLQTTNGYLLAV